MDAYCRVLYVVKACFLESPPFNQNGGSLCSTGLRALYIYTHICIYDIYIYMGISKPRAPCAYIKPTLGILGSKVCKQAPKLAYQPFPCIPGTPQYVKRGLVGSV